MSVRARAVAPVLGDLVGVPDRLQALNQFSRGDNPGVAGLDQFHRAGIYGRDLWEGVHLRVLHGHFGNTVQQFTHARLIFLPAQIGLLGTREVIQYR